MDRCSYCWTSGDSDNCTLIRCTNVTDMLVELEDGGIAHVCDEHLERVREILEDGEGMILAEDPGLTETIH